jgi:hypothetical protein
MRNDNPNETEDCDPDAEKGHLPDVDGGERG